MESDEIITLSSQIPMMEEPRVTLDNDDNQPSIRIQMIRTDYESD